ncbi:hypothetical protein E4U57_006183 [Claviceps arundinis]|uniref:Uncharacterized protein n=1 Tax=Claviceps arundinis TaxID=1623583 RepID=A0ABQ7P4A0_9HYPO|nr:hypothetical protein E4U57_006183 [Claviceps arundinis]
MRITRHALAQTVPELTYAQAELEKQRRDESHQFTRCTGRRTRSLGMPCWHRLVELLRTNDVLQASDYDVHC